MKMNGMSYEYWCARNREDYRTNRHAEISLDGHYTTSQLEDYDCITTKSYITLRLAQVTRRDFSGDIRRVAVTAGQVIQAIEDPKLKEAETIKYPDRESALDAVANGDCDVTYVYQYTAQQYVNRDMSGKMIYTILESPSYDYQITLVDSFDHEIIGIIDKCINHLDAEAIDRIAMKYTDYQHGSMTLMELIRYNPEMAFLFLGIILVLILALMGLEFYQKRKELATATKHQKELEAAYQAAENANRAKTTFLNNMSHDIRTPMNAIIGFTSLAISHADKKEQVTDYLNKIQVSGNHLLSLINDVLDMSRIESGKVKIDETKVHLPTVLHDLNTIIRAEIQSKQLDLFIDSNVVHEDVIADPLRLNQILLNLVSNAIKFTPVRGRVSILLTESEPVADGRAEFQFRVKDNGIGMSRDFQKHIFESFSREENSTVNRIQGTGLGMAITKNIVDMMGGTITVESEEGKGTEFTVSLKFRVCPVSTAEEDCPELRGMRVLVADDNCDTCVSVTNMLNTIGVRSDWTTSGKEAELRAQMAIRHHDEFSAYLIDWQMPDLNGVEVARRIRKLAGANKPIIILTAYDWSDIEAEARESGVTSFVSKPVFLSELREVLSRPYQAEPQAVPQKAKPDFSGKRILLAEDNALNREIAMKLLSEYGFAVECAENGAVAIEKLQTADAGYYDVILMDIHMPHVDGYEASRKIRSMADPQKAGIPILAMTADAFEEDRKAAIEAGMNNHISKPINLPELLKKLSELLP